MDKMENESTEILFSKEKSLFSRLNEKPYTIRRKENKNEQ